MHQDYHYWHELDGMVTVDTINLALLLDDVGEYNGPAVFIPKSHKNIHSPHLTTTKNINAGFNKSLTYILKKENICKQIRECGR